MFVAAARFLKNCTIIHSVRKRCRTIRVCSIECCLCRGSLRGWGISMLANNKLQYQQRFTWKRPPSPLARKTNKRLVYNLCSVETDRFASGDMKYAALLVNAVDVWEICGIASRWSSFANIRAFMCLMCSNIYKRTVANYHIAWKCMMIVWHVVWL